MALDYSYPTITISEDGAVQNRRNRWRKTRGFSCTLLHLVSWRSRLSHERNVRPVYLDFCGTESAHRAFVANLRCGRLASLTDSKAIEILKSEQYVYAPAQRVELEAGPAVRQVVYLPELFDLDVRAQTEEIWCCAMPPRSLLTTLTRQEHQAASAALAGWNQRVEHARIEIAKENAVIELERQAYYVERSYEKREQMPYRSLVSAPPLLELDDEAIDYWALAARELCARLDNRTRYPIPPDPEFRVLLLQDLVRREIATLTYRHPLAKMQPNDRTGRSFETEGGECGYLAPIGVRVSQSKLGEIVKELAGAYYGTR